MILYRRQYGKAGGCQIIHGGVAQLGEHLPCKQGVMSSNLTISIGRSFICHELRSSSDSLEHYCATNVLHLENFIQRSDTESEARRRGRRRIMTSEKYNKPRRTKVQKRTGNRPGIHKDAGYPGSPTLRTEGKKRGQAEKSTGRMPWHQEPMKDVTSCEKLRGGAHTH